MAVAKPRNLDCTEMNEGVSFRTPRLPEGDYRAKIVDVSDKQSKNGDDMWVFAFQIIGQNAIYPYYCTLLPKFAWKVSKIFEAATGKPLPRKRNLVNPNLVIGKVVGVALVDDDYQGKPKSSVANVFSADSVPAAPTPVREDEDEEVPFDSEAEITEDDIELIEE